MRDKSIICGGKICGLTDEPDWSEIELTDVERLLRPKLPRQLIQPILAALPHQQTLIIEYQSVMPYDIRVRVISPNHLFFANNRYHLHAYCHEKQQYLKFIKNFLIIYLGKATMRLFVCKKVNLKKYQKYLITSWIYSYFSQN